MNDKTVDTEIKSESKLTLSPKLLPLSAIVTFLIAYTHFFGMSYRKSFLEGVGFEALSINISPDESIYFAVRGLTGAISKLLKLEIELFDLNHLIPGAAFSIFFIIIWANKKYQFIKKNESEKSDDLIRSFIDKMTDTFFKTSIISIISLFSAYFLQLLLAFLFIFTLATLWIIMALGIAAGESDGHALINKTICTDFDWADEKKKGINRVLGCRRITLNDGREIKGVYIHREKERSYFLANDGAYELNANKKVLSYRPIYKRLENNITNKIIKKQ
ncbi:hypothetical protein AN214_01230 [Pseudoalteromonas sp. P1-9]|uniref:hypothetical protein n=1 Tax=Pseudoalteromonas sp. P1-9 TaxID=1710354 RepID=UPI00070814C3|nr:hypothetical protein [Pseudoalteromonas sp. P1-9]KPV96769.1 hypothetical protein AN214_01230 [Pseudoalteromonas sp. P1-9]